MLENLDKIIDFAIKEARKCSVVRLSYIMRVIATCICLFTLSLQYLTLKNYLADYKLPLLWDDAVSNCLEHMCVVFIIVMTIIISCRTWLALFIVEKMNDEEMFPWVATVLDTLECIGSFIYLMSSINACVSYYNDNIMVEHYDFLKWVAIIHIVILALSNLHNHNQEVWERANRRYTEFYDSEGKRIYIGAYVQYHRKLYVVQKQESTEYLGSARPGSLDNDTIDLEDAARDIDGMLTIVN